MNIAIVGATGAVGQELLRVLEQRRTPVASLRLFASERSAGATLPFRKTSHKVEPLTRSAFDAAGFDYAFFSAGASVSRDYAPIAVRSGAVVIDNSSAFRMDAEVPLGVPEINAEAIRAHRGIIAVPNCTAIILCMAVHPLHRLGRIRRIVVSTYQAISGAGARALAELQEQTRQAAAGQPVTPKVLPHPVIHNVFSHNTAIGPDGYNGEETKVVHETRKILGDDTILVSPTCVRVPVPRAHAESINLTFERPVTVAQAREALSRAPGVRLVDDRERNTFPMPVDASGGDDVLVGRIREDLSQPDGRGLNLFACGDQLRKGAALDAVQILEVLTSVGSRSQNA